MTEKIVIGLVVVLIIGIHIAFQPRTSYQPDSDYVKELRLSLQKAKDTHNDLDAMYIERIITKAKARGL